MHPFGNPHGHHESRLSQFRAELERQELAWARLKTELESHRGTQLWVEALPTIETEPVTPIFGVRG
jgi:hypothetical protein